MHFFLLMLSRIGDNPAEESKQYETSVSPSLDLVGNSWTIVATPLQADNFRDMSDISVARVFHFPLFLFFRG